METVKLRTVGGTYVYVTKTNDLWGKDECFHLETHRGNMHFDRDNATALYESIGEALGIVVGAKQEPLPVKCPTCTYSGKCCIQRNAEPFGCLAYKPAPEKPADQSYIPEVGNDC